MKVTRLKKVLQSEYAESDAVYRSWEGAFEGGRAGRIFFGRGLRTYNFLNKCFLSNN